MSEPLFEGRGASRVEVDAAVVVRDGRRVLDDVTVAVEPGRILAVTGPSGAGKSTLLWLIAGLIEPDAGVVRGADRGSGAAIILQGYGLVPVLTAAENAEVALQIAGRPADEVRQRATEALDRVGLDEAAGRLVEELSGGQRQRVAVARALAAAPRLLVADEPTAELDAETALVVARALREEAEAGAAVVLATHDPDLASLCDAHVHLVDGRVVDA